MNDSISPPAPLENVSIISFTGEDVLPFLQGQLSNDVTDLKQNWQFAGYCNPKGRLLAILQLWKVADTVYATLDSSVVDAIIKRLRMYVMRSKVVIEKLEAAQCFGLLGSQLNAARFSLEVSENTHKLNYQDQQLIVQFSDADSVPEELGAGGVTSDEWNASNISRGLPSITADTSELFIPQMVNLDLIGGINFKKGCYTGQEIVARMHYLGKLKQRMFVCQLNGNADAGAKVLAIESSLGAVEGSHLAEAKTAGNLVSVAPEQGLVLAVLRSEMVASHQSFALENGAELTVQDSQPYDIL